MPRVIECLGFASPCIHLAGDYDRMNKYLYNMPIYPPTWQLRSSFNVDEFKQNQNQASGICRSSRALQDPQQHGRTQASDHRTSKTAVSSIETRTFAQGSYHIKRSGCRTSNMNRTFDPGPVNNPTHSTECSTHPPPRLREVTSQDVGNILRS